MATKPLHLPNFYCPECKKGRFISNPEKEHPKCSKCKKELRKPKTLKEKMILAEEIMKKVTPLLDLCAKTSHINDKIGGGRHCISCLDLEARAYRAIAETL